MKMPSAIGIFIVFILYTAYVEPRPNLNEFDDFNTQSEHIFKWRDTSKTCGYESCPRLNPDLINVHIVPHTHDDVGWLKTLNQYYYGSNTRTQHAGVQYILDSVVRELVDNPARKFSYVESAFFFLWWGQQTNRVKDQVKQLVDEGRLEFIGGAWVMNDEATVHYQSVIDQFTFGLKKLNDTFGKCAQPRVGWQIDPFGHSKQMASLFAQMGYDGLFFSRMDYQDKGVRLTNKNAEFVWEASANLGDSSDLFTGLLYNHYSPPPGFCFDYLCGDDPIIDGKTPDNNVNRKIEDFTNFINRMQNYYKTNNLIITMGDDFHYESAGMWYKNLDKLIRYVNERQTNGSRLNLFYSTPSCYLKSLHDANTTWATKSDDFFPYSSDPHAFWTGYYTSRSNKKRFERQSNQYLQVCKQLSAQSTVGQSSLAANLEPLQKAMGVLQHHDALTGTEKQHVNSDYSRMLYNGVRSCASNIEFVLNNLVNSKENNHHPFEFVSCHHLNISQCELSENAEQFIVTVYNPKAHVSTENIRIPVPEGTYSIHDHLRNEITSQLVPIPTPVKELKFRNSSAINELVFAANDLPALGYRSYYIIKVSIVPVNLESKLTKSNIEVTIGNEWINATFGENGLLKTIGSNGTIENVNQTFYYYEGALGNNAIFANRSSGAYIFRPNSTAIPVTDHADIELYEGPVVDEIHQKFSDWVSQVIRIYKNENHIELEWLVGPIPIDDGIGKEVISRFGSNIQSNSTFETDSNGREMLTRRLNHRPTWNVSLEEPVAGNYYPVTAKIAIEDERNRLAVLNDRAQGGSSLQNGSVELMIHRRLLHDDAFGVGEALNELAYGDGIVARGHFYLVFGPSALASEPTPYHSADDVSQKAQERWIQLHKLLPAAVFFSNATDLDMDTWQNNYENEHAGLTNPVPHNVNLLTLEPWSEDSVLVRLEHFLEKFDDDHLSGSAVVNLQDIFGQKQIRQVRETTLAANQYLEDSKRLQFTKNGAESTDSCKNDIPKSSSPDNLQITLEPMEIRTFIVSFY